MLFGYFLASSKSGQSRVPGGPGLSGWVVLSWEAAAEGTQGFLCLCCSYHLPFLLVSLKIGWINIPLLASTEAPELQRIVLICAWDGSWFSSDLLLCLNWFDQARWFWKCLLLPFLTSASYLTLQDPCQCPGACGCHRFRATCSDCRTEMSYSLCKSDQVVEVFLPFLVLSHRFMTKKSEGLSGSWSRIWCFLLSQCPFKGAHL